MTTPRKLGVWPKSETGQPSGGRREPGAWAEIAQSLADGDGGALRRAASGARESSGAVFVAIARDAAGGRGVSFAAVDGPAGTEAALGQKSFVPVWRAALEEQRAIFSATAGGREGANFPGCEPVESVLAIPLKAQGEAVGLLVAGWSGEAQARASRERLEEWAPLAALALMEARRGAILGVRDRWLGALLDSMENAVLLLEADGNVRRANERLPKLLGIAPERMANVRTFDELLDAARGNFRDPRAAEARWREIQRREDEVAWDEVELARPVPRVLERFARPVRGGDGERLGWLELYREANEEQRLRSRLSQTEKLAAMGELVSGIAHELNNPLTSIVGYAQLLLERSGGSARSDEAHHIFEEARRAGAIVRNLLLMARAEKPERKAVNLNEIVERTLSMRDYELRVSNIRVEVELEPGLPAVMADAHQMQQMVLNLLVNAQQSIETSRGRGGIRVRTQLLRHVQPRRVRLEVEDDGAGIPREILPRVFDPFFTTKSPGTGTGLGLSIVYSIVQEHGGEVRAETGAERGATFVVELPATAARESGGGRPVPEHSWVAAERVSRASGTRQRVLVVEDEPTVASLVADVVREEGHDVETILDSVAALERLTRQEFDLVICDLKMPRMDGRALYEEGVRRGRIRRTGILFITGDTLRPRTLDFVNRDRLPYLAKPFLVDELTKMVRQVLNGQAAAVAAARPDNLPRVPVEEE